MDHTTYSFPATLTLNRLRLMVQLGYGEEERLHPQPVDVTITLYLTHLPRGCTDDGKGFLCYDRLSQALARITESTPFQLIEYLTLQLAGAVDAWIAKEAPAACIERVYYTLNLHKCLAPVDGLQDGTTFSYTTHPNGL